MKCCKTAILGYGGMGAWHVDKLKTMPEIEVTGTFDILPERQEAARQQGIFTYGSFEEMLADDTVELVTIATPNDLHKPQAIRLMQAGKNIVCEKPVSLGCNDFEEMIAVAKTHNVLFTVHQNRRWDEDFLIVKKLLSENRLGNVFCVESRVHGSRGIPGDWRNKKIHGGGMVLDWGVHLLDQILMLNDNPIVSVYARLMNVTNEEVEDGFVVIIVFKDGMRAHVEVGTSNFIAMPRWYLTGENGSALIENWNLEGKIVMLSDWHKCDAVPINTAAGLTRTMAPRTEETIKEFPLPTVKSDVRDFYRNVVEVLRKGIEPLITHDQQRRLMKLMDAVFYSAKTECAVNMPE